jgi:hypothetical protein
LPTPDGLDLESITAAKGQIYQAQMMGFATLELPFRLFAGGHMTGIIGLVFWSAIGLAPVASVLLIVSHIRRRDRLTALPPVTAFVGFLVGGVAGWTSMLPALWTASFWATVEAAGNSVKYGESFEHTAERALMYFLYPAELGAIVFGLAALLLLSRIPVPRSATPVR